jgi:hypothetical protein
VAFDWACKVAAVVLAYIPLLAIIFGGANFWSITLPAAETTIEKIFQWFLACAFGLALIVMTCRAIYLAWRPRDEIDSGVFYAMAIAFVVGIASSEPVSSGGFESWIIFLFWTTGIVVSIRLIISELPIDSIKISLKNGAMISWTGLTDGASQSAQNDLINTMSEPKTPP